MRDRDAAVPGGTGEHGPDERGPDERGPDERGPEERGPDASRSTTASGESGDGGPDTDLPMLTDELPPVVDWARTGRRMATSLAVIGAIIVVTWLGVGVASGGVRARLLGELVGIGLLAAFLVEVVVVGGAALRGVIRAGDRGERLAGSDVSLLPPQVRRRRHR